MSEYGQSVWKILLKLLWKILLSTVIITREFISFWSHPAELLTVPDNITQVTIRYNTGIIPQQSCIAMDTTDIQASAVTCKTNNVLLTGVLYYHKNNDKIHFFCLLVLIS